jgi:hypothetical protein
MKAYAGFGASPGAELTYCGRLRDPERCRYGFWLSRAHRLARPPVHGQIIFVRTGVHNPMKIITRPERTLTIQLREFERPAKGGKRGGRMKLKASKTITVHDVTIDEIHSRILHALKGETR